MFAIISIQFTFPEGNTDPPSLPPSAFFPVGYYTTILVTLSDLGIHDLFITKEIGKEGRKRGTHALRNLLTKSAGSDFARPRRLTSWRRDSTMPLPEGLVVGYVLC